MTQDTAKPRKKNRSAASLALGGLGMAVLVCCAIVCVIIVVPRLFGIVPYAVATGSMEPSLPVGSLVYAQEVDPAELEPGDVVTFSQGHQRSVPVTHRVVSNDPMERELVTQGDANASPDPEPVPYSRVRGEVVLSVPLLGFIATGLSMDGGKLALVAVIGASLALCFVADRLRE